VVACDGRWGDQMGPSVGELWIPAFAGMTDKALKNHSRTSDRPYILISAASTMASAISRMDLRNFMLFC
jgi:hypothetical protein